MKNNSNSKYKRIIKNPYISTMITKLFFVLLGLVNAVLINRYLGPTLKGQYSVILNSVNLVVLVLNLGIYQSYPYIKKKYGNDNLKDQYINIVFFQAVVYLMASLIISIIVRKYEWTIILTLAPIMILTRQLSFITLIEKIHLRNLINSFNSFIYTLILLIFVLFTESNYMFIISSLYIKDIIFIVMIILAFKLKPKIFKVEKQVLMSSIRYGFLPMITLLLIDLNYKVDVIIMNFYVSDYVIGIYSIGVLLAEKVWIASDVFKEVLFSKSARENVTKEFTIAIKFNIYFSILMLAFILIAGKFIIKLLFGIAFIEAYQVTTIIFAGISGMAIYKVIYPYYISNGYQMKALMYLTITSFSNILLNFILIPTLGINGAAIASVFSYNLCGILFLINFKKLETLRFSEFFCFNKQDMDMVKGIIRRIL